MKAIDTHYNGYLFRSRLEARWAVFFDVLGMQWEYEPEGFELGGGVRYLPDFKVISPQGFVYWYEIKPAHIDFDDKFDLFDKHLQALYSPEFPERATLLRGDPIEVFFERRYGQGEHLCPRCGGVFFLRPDYSATFEISVECDACDWDTPSGRGNPPEPGFLATSVPRKGLLLVDWCAWGDMVRRIRAAALAARSARFEWGKCSA